MSPIVSFCAIALFGLLSVSCATHIAPNDPNLFFSPYGWSITATQATTVNSGSYFRCIFSGNSVVLNFDVSKMVSPPSQLYTKIDNGPLTRVVIAPQIFLNVSAPLSGADIPYHTLEVVVKSTTETANRWSAQGLSTRIVFLGLDLDANGHVAAWFPSTRNVLIYGDSITEGVLTLGGSQRYDTDHNDATVCWSWALGALLGAETGVIGFGATGLSRGGSGGVPALGVSWNQLWDGVPRVFTPKPDLIVLNEGTNDGSTDIVQAMTTVLNNLLTACPGTPIAVLRPFNGAEADNLVKAIAASAQPSLIHYIDTTGFYDYTYGGNLHPAGPNDVARIAPQVAAKLRPLL